jgi:hypothetical protein
MYCSTCGAYLSSERATCAECGARAPSQSVDRRPHSSGSGPAERGVQPNLAARGRPRYGPEDGRWLPERSIAACPRCGYRGEGVTYFSRGIHAAALIGVTVFTAGAMGAGGLIYYLIRREHLLCPRCGRGWGRHGELSLAPTSEALAQRAAPPLPSPSRERGSRTLSVLLFLFAAIMLTLAVTHMELAPFIIGGFAAAGGVATHYRANEQRERRRAALLEQLQLPVLRLARERGGRLTVTEVAASLGWPLPRAEKVLNSLEDGLRVNSDVTSEGVIVYDFWDFMHRPDRLPPPDPAPPMRRMEGSDPASA